MDWSLCCVSVWWMSVLFFCLNNTSGVCNTTLGGRFGHDTALVHRFTYCLAKGWNANDELSTIPVEFESPKRIPRTTTTHKQRQQLAISWYVC